MTQFIPRRGFLLASGISFSLSRVIGQDKLKLMPPDRWWPAQKAPRGVIRTPLGRPADQMLTQSLAGLAARAVNEGKLDEMVWIVAGGPDYDEWYAGMIKRLKLEERGTLAVWDLAERFKQKGIYKGYILYRFDTSEGRLWRERPNCDESVNVATTLAGLMDAILIDESQEKQAQRLGLAKLFDARGKDMAWCFDKYHEQLSRSILLTGEPKWANNRAMTIAQRGAAVWGIGETTNKAAEWVNPPAPATGWNAGDEFKQTDLLSEYGQFQGASTSAWNLEILSAGTDKAAVPKIKSLDPRTIDWNDKRHLASFMMSDGDNLSWLMKGFFSEPYWDNPANGKFPFGWEACLCHLAQLCPEALQRLARTQPEGTTLIEPAGGYAYADLLAHKRPNRPEVLARLGRLISAQLAKTGGRVMRLICKDVLSEDAKEAFEIYAREIEPLAGIVVIQYSPYEGGHGRVFWVKNRKGIEIPVVTLTHSIWNHARWPTGGTPAKVARMINESTEHARFSFVSVHAWSWFKEAPGTDERAEEMAQEGDELKTTGAARGLTPVSWCVGRLSPQVKVVSPEELIWRLRMEHNPDETRKLLND